MEVIGQKWTQGKTDPTPQNGQNYFFAGAELEAELSQIVVLSNDLCKIDRGAQSFQFGGYVRAYPQNPPDQSQIIIEMLNSNSSILQSYDLGVYSTTDRWTAVSKTMNAPPQTRKIKIRLLSHRKNGSDNDGYFDNLILFATTSSIVIPILHQSIRPSAKDNHF